MRVLYDGWALVHQPDSPQALHLLALLANLRPEVHPLLALPGAAPDWLPDDLETITLATRDNPRSRLAWEQRLLPLFARRHQADLIHLVTHTPALFTGSPSLISPAGMLVEQAGGGFWSRLRRAAAQGGMSRLAGLLWPEDVHQAAPRDLAGRIFALPPMIYPGFLEESGDAPGIDLPETFLLYHGSYETRSLLRLLDAWSWAAGPIGEYYPLLLLGADAPGRQTFESLAASYDLDASVRLLPNLPPWQMPAVYRACTAIFHPAPALPWENPLRAGLVSGKAVVAMDSPLAGLLCGPAAYLVDGENARSLGAALITVIVEDGLRESLEKAALQRAAAWRLAQRAVEFGDRLLEIYRQAVGAQL